MGPAMWGSMTPGPLMACISSLNPPPPSLSRLLVFSFTFHYVVGVVDRVLSPVLLSWGIVGVFLCVCRCVIVFREILDIRASHSCTCMCSVIAIVWA